MSLHVKNRIKYYFLQIGRFLLLIFSINYRKENKRLRNEIQKLKAKRFLNIDEAYNLDYFKSTPFIEEQKYAMNISQVVCEVFKPKSVVDVGCGKGLFLDFFYKKGIKIKGYEGSGSAIKLFVLPRKYVEKVDLRKQIKTSKHYDVAISWEVAEHIEKEFVAVYITNLIKLSNTIVFTAAEPFLNPPHPHHPNEQFSEYWDELFKFFDYKKNTILTNKLQNELIHIGLPPRLEYYTGMKVYTHEKK
ncbi:hypothetical protein BH10PAT1_BH10PAT1_2950 [soil metagenome]